MNRCQIVAGISPPKPAPGTAPTGDPCQTVAESCGVKPRNHASVLLSVVPVLPATARPESCAPVPVPPATTPRRISVAQAATSGDTAGSPGRPVSSTRTVPSPATTLCTKYGSRRTPLAAIVAPTVAISSGVDSIVPSVAERIGCSVS